MGKDVYLSGVTLPLARRGLVLTGQYINKLKDHGVPFVYIEQAKGYKGAPGQTITLTSVESDIIFEGQVNVKGNVPANMSIDAGEIVVIEGNVAEGCHILSRTGAIAIKGSVYGTNENLVHLRAKHNVSVGNTTRAVIKTDREFTTEGDIIDTIVDAKGEVKVGGRVIRSRITTDARMLLGQCGNEEYEPCSITVTPLEYQETAQELLKTDSVIRELSKEKAQLQNVIDLIKKLGSSVDRLSEDKKIELAKGVKRFKDIDGELSVLSARKAELEEKLKEILAVRRIIIDREIYSNIKVQIGNKILAVTAKEKRVAFCIKGNTIVMEKMA